jgi:hypothetical protein
MRRDSLAPPRHQIVIVQNPWSDALRLPNQLVTLSDGESSNVAEMGFNKRKKARLAGPTNPFVTNKSRKESSASCLRSDANQKVVAPELTLAD